ncbi:unnamed protein product, partial [marine sediment metagenome]
YEEPENPEITIDTDRETIEEGVSRIISYLEENGFIENRVNIYFSDSAATHYG